MLRIVYKELFPVEDPLNPSDKDIQKIEELLTKTAIKHRDGAIETKNFWVGPINIQDMFANGVNTLLSANPENLSKGLKDIYSAEKKQREECDKTCECGVSEVKLSGIFGMTIGPKTIGFCRPDRNPIHRTVKRDKIWTKKVMVDDEGEKYCGMEKKYGPRVDKIVIAASYWIAIEAETTYDLQEITKINKFALRIKQRVPGSISSREVMIGAAVTPFLEKVAEYLNSDEEVTDVHGFWYKGRAKVTAWMGGLFALYQTKFGGAFDEIFTSFQDTAFEQGFFGMIKGILENLMAPLFKSIEVKDTPLMGFDISYEIDYVADNRKIGLAFENVRICELIMH